MIFVTVGTHEQQFNRLVKAVDDLVIDGVVDEPVYIQTGYSDYVPKKCDYSGFLSFKQMNQLMQEADVVITHGGPSSFIESLAVGKVPVVVPRRQELGEHVNNHQVAFVHQVAEKQKLIIPCDDLKHLYEAIDESRIATRNCCFESNNAVFCSGFEKLIRGI